jgi:hypothetical protein
MSELPRELEAFLSGPPAQRPSAAFRERLLEETEILLPRPWFPRHFAVRAAACLVVSVLGLFASWALLRRPITQASLVPATLAPVEAIQLREIASLPLSPAEALEWQAIESSSFRPQIYWNAGQAYMAEDGDYLSALRCYRQALDATPPELCQVTDDDDLLAMILKFDRSHQEKKNEMP